MVDRFRGHDRVGDGGQVGGGLGGRRAGPQPSEHAQEVVAVRVHVIAGRERHRHEELRVDAHERELRRQDAHDHVRFGVDRDGPADRRGIAGVAAMPQAGRDDGDPVTAPLLVLGDERAAGVRENAESREEARGDRERRDAFGTRVAGQVDRASEERVEMRQRAVLAAIVVEIRRRGHARRARRGVDGADRDETRRILIRERPEQQGVHDAEHHRVGADPHRERREHDRGEPRAAPDQPRREAQVLCDGLDHRQAPALAIELPGLFEAAEPGERDPSRFDLAHAGAAVVVDVHLQVRRQLLVELTVVAAPEQRGQAHEGRTHGPHDCSPRDRKRSRIADVRSHSRVSRSTRFRPARVSR